MKCKHCGAEMSDYHVFCTKCGQPLDMYGGDPSPTPMPKPEPAPTPVPGPAPKPIPKPVSAPASKPAAKPKRAAAIGSGKGLSGKMLLTAALGLVGAAVIIGGAAMIAGRKAPAPPETAAAEVTAAVSNEASGPASAPPETPSPMPTAEPTPSAAPDFRRDAVLSVSASSSLIEQSYGISHTPEKAIDGDLTTGWAENAPGAGVGESITLFLDSGYTVRGFVIHAGYQKSASLYERNARPAVLKLSFSNGESQSFTLQDLNGQQRILFAQPVETDRVTFTIESVYNGTTYQDTVISELMLF